VRRNSDLYGMLNVTHVTVDKLTQECVTH